MKIEGALAIAIRPGLLGRIISFCWNRLVPGLALGCAVTVNPYVIAATPIALLVKLQPMPARKPLKKSSTINQRGG